MSDAPKLIGGPYKRPADVRPQQRVKDEQSGEFLVCQGFSRAPIEWPIGGTGSKMRPILCGDLVKAVRTEAAEAIVYHWGVSRDTVKRWRRALGVGRMTPGTAKRWSELADDRLGDSRAKGGRLSKQPRKLIAKMRACLELRKGYWTDEEIAVVAEADAYLADKP